MSASHTTTKDARDLRSVPGLGLIDIKGTGLPKVLAEKVEGELAVFAEHMREGLLSAAVNVGLSVFGELMATEVTEICGKKGHHDPARRAVRHGAERSSVPMGGRVVAVDKPRVRAVDGSGEVALEVWKSLSSRELLDRHTLISMLAGVSTRSYATLLEPTGHGVEATSSSTSKSSVSRRFVEATKTRLQAFRSRPLDDRRFVVVYIDGFGFAEETLVAALGVDEAGHKVPLSVVHGTTENKAVCKKLLDDIEDRGFDASAGVLFVIDGGKAIYHAIKDKWGDQALIQRCRAHKERNIVGLLPDAHHAWVRRDLRRAWAMGDPGDAERTLRALATKIERTHPDAAASLREGLTDTITVNRLGVTGSLLKTVATTNPMESTVDVVKVHARNVKRWMPGDMRLRWAAAGMVAAEAQYHRVHGYRQIGDLVSAIHAAVTRTRQLAEAS